MGRGEISRYREREREREREGKQINFIPMKVICTLSHTHTGKESERIGEREREREIDGLTYTKVDLISTTCMEIMHLYNGDTTCISGPQQKQVLRHKSQ